MKLLLGNVFTNKHVPTGTIGVQQQKVLLRSLRWEVITETSLEASQLQGNLWKEDLVDTVEQSSLLEAVTWERLVKTGNT
jgi:hypothetical protein